MPRSKKWIAPAFVLVALVTSYAAYTSAMYPASFAANEEAYNELARLTLACCSGPDYMADVRDVERDDTKRARLMHDLGVDRVHYYAGNRVYPGAVVYLERDLWGPLGGMYAYSVDGGPKRIVSCYTAEHVEGNWYRGHSLPCLFGH